MKMRHKMVCVLLVFLLLAGTVIGAGRRDEPDDRITITYLSKWNPGEVIQGIVNDVIQQYMEDNPNVRVVTNWAGREVNVALMASIQAGNPPDIYDEDPPIIESALGRDGLAVDLKPYMQNTMGWNDNITVWDAFPQGTFDPWTYDGRIHCMPYMQYVSVFWYNKTLFDELGITETPDTWEEFLELCEFLKSKGIAPLAQDGGIDFYNLYYFSHLAERYEGAGALREAIYDRTGESWNKPGFLKAAQQVALLAQRGYFMPGFEGISFPAGQIDWAQGEAAMLLIHSYMPIEVADAVPDDFEFGAFSFPSVPGGTGNQYDLNVVVNGPAILSSSKHPDIAFDLIKRLMSEEVQQRVAEEAMNMPMRAGVPLPDIFKDLGDILEKQTGAFADYSGGPGQFEPELAQSVIFPLNDQLIFGRITPEEFITQVRDRSIAYWRRR